MVLEGAGIVLFCARTTCMTYTYFIVFIITDYCQSMDKQSTNGQIDSQVCLYSHCRIDNYLFYLL